MAAKTQQNGKKESSAGQGHAVAIYGDKFISPC
jgi:hypothetical protein